MPRSVEPTKFRRVAMQGIMWVILAGTVAAAALVNYEVRKTHGGELGPPVSLGDVSIQLPKGWRVDNEGDTFIDVHEGRDDSGRDLSVKLGPPGSLMDSLRSLTSGDDSSPMRIAQIPVGEQTGSLVVRKRPVSIEGFRVRGVYQIEVSAAAILPPGDRKITILLTELGSGQKREIDSNVDLVKRIAATVKAGDYDSIGNPAP